MARSDRPLSEQITDAARELKLARQDGGAAWIGDAARRLDELLDLVPLPQKTKG
jgi:hypothetical protein